MPPMPNGGGAAPDLTAGRWLELVPVEVFGLVCEEHELPQPVGWGLCDAVQAWSDCNRADGRIYRVDDLDTAHRLPGETARIWVADADLPFFERQWGDGYSTDPDVVDMVPPTAVREPLPKPELTAALIRDLAQMHSAVNLSFIKEDMWRWVLSPTMVNLLRDYAAVISGDLPDVAMECFGLPIRVDEHATHPMLELRR